MVVLVELKFGGLIVGNQKVGSEEARLYQTAGPQDQVIDGRRKQSHVEGRD